MKKTQPWSGWSKLKPKNRGERQTMKKKMRGKMLFRPKLSYPICKKATCKIAKSGLWSAFILEECSGLNAQQKKGYLNRHIKILREKLVF